MESGGAFPIQLLLPLGGRGVCPHHVKDSSKNEGSFKKRKMMVPITDGQEGCDP